MVVGGGGQDATEAPVCVSAPDVTNRATQEETLACLGPSPSHARCPTCLSHLSFSLRLSLSPPVAPRLCPPVPWSLPSPPSLLCTSVYLLLLPRFPPYFLVFLSVRLFLSLSDQGRGQVCAGVWQIPTPQGPTPHPGLTQPPGFWAGEVLSQAKATWRSGLRSGSNPTPVLPRTGHLPFAFAVRVVVQESDRMPRPLLLKCLGSAHPAWFAKMDTEPRPLGILLGLHSWLWPMTWAAISPVTGSRARESMIDTQTQGPGV